MRTLKFLARWAVLVGERLARLPLHPKLRAQVFRLLGARIGKDVRIDEIQCINLAAGFRHLTVHDHAYIGGGTLIDLMGSVEIGAHASVSPGCAILTHADPGTKYGNELSAEYPRKIAAVVIGAHSWIGARVTILCGSRIGHHAIVGAMSLVTHDVPEHAVAYGVPAKCAQERTTSAVKK